jgi:hypothetical protein
MLAIAIAAAIATSPAQAAARPRAQPTLVDGVVVDREGHGIGGALVVPRLANATPAPGDPLVGGVVADRAGRFRLIGLPPGEYVFIAVRGADIGVTPEMPVVDHLTVTIWIDQATRA